MEEKTPNSSDTMFLDNKSFPTTGRFTPLFYCMELIYVLPTNFIKIFWYTLCDTWNSPTYEDMIYFVVILQHQKNCYAI
jgi:hypothetical protein